MLLVCEEIPVCLSPEPTATEPCNGFVELCSRPYDKTVFATTHNSYAAQKDGFIPFNANQFSGLERQLNDGIRALMLDVHEDGGETALCHTFCFLGRASHRGALAEIRDFLDTHPREVLTLLYEDHVSPRRIESDFLSLGMERFVYTHPRGTAWPTLGEMIEAGTRLVVMGEHGSPPPAWFHPLWTLASDNPYGQKRESDFDCSPHRGQPSHALLLMNHWLNTPLDFPWEEGALFANGLETLYPRSMDCIQERRRLPNFLAVNYYEHGDLLATVELLNGVNYDADILRRALRSLSGMRQPQDFLLFGSEVYAWPLGSPIPGNRAKASLADPLALVP